jgi:hypothetical protein
MKLDLAGKIKNTQLPRYKALLPMFEAVVNSFQAIEDAPQKSSITATIEITVERDQPLNRTLEGMEVESAVNGFTVVDNGVGFNETNLEAFFTSDTQYKLNKGGKGLGRFVWLKAFDRAHIESHFATNGYIRKRAFDFTLTGDQPTDAPSDSEEKAVKTIVRLIGMKSPYRENCPRTLNLIAQRLIEHCLPFFLDPKCPAISISDKNELIDLKTYFAQVFASKATKHDFKVQEQSFTMRGLCLFNPHETQHRLLYAANYREVTTERLERHLPNLQKRLFDSKEEKSFVYLGFIEGWYLDQTTNNERTGFTFPLEKDPDASALFEEITLAAIRDAALKCVTKDLAPFLEEINDVKRETITSYIHQEAPEYRPLTRYINEFIDQVPPGAKGSTLEVVLHQQLYQKQRQIRQESRALMADVAQTLRPEEYEEKINNFLERANELGKSSLAQYVVHRKVILDFLEKSLQSNPETGKYPLEEVIHRIIYPMHTTSDDVPYEQQNLWIIDERLSYHSFLASDMRLDGMGVLASSSASRPDILIFERALTFTEDEGALNSLVIIEFKRPDRSSYEKGDPIDQVYRLIREIKAGHFKDKNGREIKVQNERIPAYAYVICDTTKEVETIAENKNMLPTPDALGYYGYNQTLSAYVEIISYAKLLADAKKRNRILFDKLQLPT